MAPTGESTTRLMLRVRDTMDRRYAEPLDVPALATTLHLSASHLVRRFKATVEGGGPARGSPRLRP